MPKRILVIASTFPSADTDPVPAFVKDQVIALKQQYPQLDVTVLAPHDHRLSTRSMVEHEYYTERRFHYAWPRSFEGLAGRGIVPSLKAKPLYYLLIPQFFLAEFFALLRLVRQFKPDVLYAHWFTPQGVVAGAVSAVAKVPFVYSSHASDVEVWHKIPFIGKKVVRLMNKKAKRITVVSRRSLAKLRSFFDDEAWQAIEQKVAVIPMGVDVQEGRADTPKKTASQASKTILFIGRLAEKKGVAYLIEAFARVRAAHPGVKLVIAGDGPLYETLVQQAEGLGLESDITFTGYITGEAKKWALAEGDVYVVPSIITADGDAEGLPVALMEGLAAGKLCIATNESGADDILEDGKDGLLISQKNVDELEAAINRTLALTPAQQQQMRQHAKKKAIQFSWPGIARRHYEFLFEDLL